MFRKITDPNQERAVLHAAGPAQIVAGPGSGKTFTMIHRIHHLITQRGIDPGHILVITFTKAAALEVQERFFRLTQPERYPVRFGTFHAVFYYILKQSAGYQGYSIMTESAKRKHLRQIIRLHSRFGCLQEEDLEALLAEISACKTSAVHRPFMVQGITEEDLRWILQEYEVYKRELKQMDFDDMMLCCHRLLQEEADTRARWQKQFQYILIDEFQDISPIQYEIMNLLAAPENNLFVVGDDDQAIYGFRGAGPDSMQRFLVDYPEAVQILLDNNYRCHRQIVDAAGKVIGENDNRIFKSIHAVHEQGKGIELRFYENEEEKKQDLVQELQQRHKKGELAGCALIGRTNFDCAMWANVFRKNAVPFTMKEPPKSPFRHFVNQDIMAYLALADGDLSRRHFLRIMNRPVRYLKRDSVPESDLVEENLLRYYEYSPVLQERVRRLFQDIGSLRGRKLYLQIHYIRNVIGYDRYLSEKYGSLKAGALFRTADDFQEFSRQFRTLQQMQDEIVRYEETMQELQNQKSQEKKEAGQKTDQTIVLLTMHAAKGLEFKTVYLPDCQEGKIPSAKAVTKEEIEEERRMFYVAMTRARQNLYLMACKGKTGKNAPSRFLSCLSRH